MPWTQRATSGVFRNVTRLTGIWKHDDWIQLTQDREQRTLCEHGSETSQFRKSGELYLTLTDLTTCLGRTDTPIGSDGTGNRGCGHASRTDSSATCSFLTSRQRNVHHRNYKSAFPLAHDSEPTMGSYRVQLDTLKTSPNGYSIEVNETLGQRLVRTMASVLYVRRLEL